MSIKFAELICVLKYLIISCAIRRQEIFIFNQINHHRQWDFRLFKDNV